jgi:chromosome segregation ATPase
MNYFIIPTVCIANASDSYERIATYKEEQATISQAAMAIVKQEKELARRLHDKEIEAGNLENELSRVKIEIMNKTINCSRLKDQFQDEANNLTSVNRSIANTELEIRRTNDDIDRNMGTVNILNKKYEQMMEGAEEEEPLGPLEGTIRKLEKEIQMMDQEAIKLQSSWASQQSDLIKVLDANERLESENRVKGAKLTILQQKRLRLLHDINTNEAATKAISASINSMHTDISRLNDLIGRYTKMMESLGSDNVIKQIAFDDESRTLEDTAKSIEMKIATVVSEKEDLLKQIIQSEREILEWEKKIQLEKDTRKILNSSEHAIEIKGMEKEIHRMKHRLDDMNRQQEKMIRDMEFAIHKREDIAVKYQKRSGSNSKYNPVSIGEMKRTKADLHEKQMLIDQENSSVSSCERETLSSLYTTTV